MKTSDRIADLRKYFPFSLGETTLRTKALSLGKCVQYSTGETVLLSGSPAKHCGVILSGQAVAFKFDSDGRRYQLCLEEGCFIGLETLREEESYTAKIVAASELEVLFWNADGLRQLCGYSQEFSDGMNMLNEGRIYQEQWLIPETDVTDPVLCSAKPHWVSSAAPVFVVLPILLIGLTACGMLIRRYIAAWILVFALLAAAGVLLYRQLTARANERVIITSKKLILIPRDSEAEMSVTRLSGLQGISVRQNFFERLLSAGKISLETDAKLFSTPLLHQPAAIAELIHDFAVHTAQGRPIPLHTGDQPAKSMPPAATGTEQQAPAPETKIQIDYSSLPPFEPVSFRPHWAMLIKMVFKPLLVLLVSLYAVNYFRYNAYFGTILKFLLIFMGVAAAVMIYQYLSWRNHRFFIEEDCVKDYCKKPFSREELNVAMNHKIESVRYGKSGFFQSLLNYGTVYILAGEGELSFDYVAKPGQIQQLIMNTCSRYEAKLRIEEEARRRAYISDIVRELQNETNY